MKRKITVAILVVIVFGIISILMIVKLFWDCGATVTAFAQSSAASPALDEYYAQMARNLEAFLSSEGFTPTATPPRCMTAGITFTAQQEMWYRGGYQESPEFFVLVRQPTANASGLEVYVVWRVRALRWSINKYEAKFKDFRSLLFDWWYQYKETHPEPIS